jgi:MarR family transcriptional regulator for hemolysin
LAVQPDLSIDFGRALYRVAQAWRREVDQRVSSFGLTDATWRPLLHLGRLGDGVRQTDLARALGMEGPSLVRLLDVLEKSDLIKRVEDADDRRSKLLYMTRAGRRLYLKVVGVYRAIAANLLREVGEDELALCYAVIGKIERATATPAGDRDGR